MAVPPTTFGLATSARPAGPSPSCAFGHSAHVMASHRSNSIWRSRAAIAMVIYVMVATVTATSRKAG